jgi:hypothetical protein
MDKITKIKELKYSTKIREHVKTEDMNGYGCQNFVSHMVLENFIHKKPEPPIESKSELLHPVVEPKSELLHPVVESKSEFYSVVEPKSEIKTPKSFDELAPELHPIKPKSKSPIKSISKLSIKPKSESSRVLIPIIMTVSVVVVLIASVYIYKKYL